MNPFFRNFLVAVAIAATCCSPFSVAVGAESPTADEKPTTLRVAFWNIQWFPGKRPEPTHWEEEGHTPLVQNVIAEVNPDILGMCEIRDEDSANLAIAKLEQPYHVDICSRFLFDDGSIGTQQLAIASRLNPVSAWSEPWKQPAGIKLTRGFSFAAYPINDDTVVLFYAVHFKSNRGDIQLNIPAREASSKQLLSHAARMEEIYGNAYANVITVLAGDFNTSLDPGTRFQQERTLRNIIKEGYQWGWKGKPLEERETLPQQPQMDPKFEQYPAACFDHIFVKGAKILDCDIPVIAPLASDHRIVVAKIQLP